ncbi:VWA domain-containing protein [Aggregicoccus sp. 17bor-14]|uniref:VWA domain-containing protein n=1 Tax=Myxococcaceae TaxID=31 RepID=UPI00129C1B05|nr:MULTISPECIES: VWA domain-containing protein [Myxococcaceae]MBF5040989.1 VWA domain-containing protein [Simulacricoccus sp. 17bor-14]MRI86776.1 VWA domain-containing protein [Aggregicoccus sp. 17bor-14]
MVLAPLCIAVLLAAAPARVESSPEVRATHYTAEVTVDGGLATLAVSLTLQNQGSKATEVDVLLELPNEGSASEFYFTHPGSRTWQYGAMMEEGFAEQRFAQLRQRNKATASPSAMMTHVEPGVVRLRIHPARVGVPLQVRFRVQAPLRYEDGHWGVSADYRGGEGARDGAYAYTSVTPGMRMTLASTQAGVQVSADGRRLWLKAPAFVGVQGREASTALPSGGWALRVGLGVAPQLSELPHAASVVFVLDASRSEDAEGIEGQLQVLRRYLQRVPDAQVELVVFRRHAERLFGEWVPAADVEARLARLERERLAPGNGSALDEALALAARVLEGRTGTLRVVALTDGLVASRASTTAPAWPTGSVLNVGLMRVSWSVLPVRWGYVDGPQPAHALAPLAEATGGRVLALSPPGEGAAPLGEELVRPTRLEAPRLLAAGVPVPWPTAPPFLAEGAGVSDWLRLPERPEALVLEGRLWARTVRWPLAYEARVSSALRALMGNAPQGAPLTDAERVWATKESQVVGPEPYSLAHAGSVGPRVELAGEGEVQGAVAGGAMVDPPDRPTPGAGAWLEALLASGARRCGASGATVELETTFHEIVDVRVTPANSCLEEAAWALRLGRRFTQQRGHFTVRPGEGAPRAGPR